VTGGCLFFGVLVGFFVGSFIYLKQISSLAENGMLLSEEPCSGDMKMTESCSKHPNQLRSLLRQNAVVNASAEAPMGCSNYAPLMFTNTTL